MDGIDAEAAETPPRDLRFKRRIRIGASLRELWRARELVHALVERQLRARYKQAVLGVAWAVITPVVLTVAMSLFVQRVVTIQTKGIPYPLFAYVALIPWSFFSTSVTQASLSLAGNTDLLDKVHFPREVFPVAGVVTASVDMVVALLPLAILFVAYTFVPKATALWFPVLFMVQAVFTLGVALLTSALTVYVRDVRHALPLLIQFGLFVTPIAYGIEQIPQSERVLYSFLNPLAPVIDGYRRTVLFGQSPDWHLLGAGATTAIVVLGTSILIFKRLEAGFADVA
jgi:ABC-type polysaccharide/polyol phosphate export permease